MRRIFSTELTANDSRMCKQVQNHPTAVVPHSDEAYVLLKTENTDVNPENDRKPQIILVKKFINFSTKLTSLFAYSSLANVKSECSPQTRQ